MKITVKASAKINLSLDIEGVRKDGYHLLNTVMQSVSLYDYINIDTDGKGISLSGNLKYVPYNEKNIAYKAAKLFFDLVKEEPHVKIDLIKHIPVCAGMGGGSSNAAAVLLGLNKAFGDPIAKETLCKSSVSLGADVPFFFYGGTKQCKGIGEKITDIPSMPQCPIVILKDKTGVSTAAAFSAFDKNPKATSNTENIIAAIENKDLSSLGNSLGNALYDNSAGLCPQITKNIEILKSFGAYSCMTGSGSAVFGLFESNEQANKAFNECKGNHDNTVLCAPTENSILFY